ncbi:fluoride efflux transporter CrcB [Paenibacillus apiarius]|uniref:fluoride efflux transporter CrcB n=1 Tax=Paenibacillus apiarius TaxID=46240 RepID=UPI003B3A3760
MSWLLVAVGGACGAWCRFRLGAYVSKRSGSDFPWGTFVINAAGSLLLGLLYGCKTSLPPLLYLGGAAGFCGAFTTFSTFSYEAISLMMSDKRRQALFYIMMSAATGLLAAAIGYGVTGFIG